MLGKHYFIRLAVVFAHIVAVLLVLGMKNNNVPDAPDNEPVAIQLVSPADVSTAAGESPPEPVNKPDVPAPRDPPQRRDETSAQNQPEKKRRWQSRSVEAIRKDGLRTEENSTNPRSRRDPRQVTREIEKGLKRLEQSVSISSAEEAGPRQHSDMQAYYSRLHRFLYGRWDPPAGARLASRQDGVDVKLDIRRNGQLLGRKVVKSGANTALTRSVVNLLKRLSYVPSPADHGLSRETLSVVVTFRVDEG